MSDYPTQVSKAIKAMDKKFTEERVSRDTNTVFAGVFQDKDHVQGGSTACFMSVQHSGQKGLDWLISHIQTTSLCVEDQMTFLSYLFNDSPFQEVFVTKDAGFAIANEWIVMDAHHPSNLVLAGAVATRCLSESPHVVVAFCDLLKGGVEADLAFMLAHHFQGSSGRGGNVHWDDMTECHRCMSPRYMSKDNLNRFLDHEPASLNSHLHDDNNYSGIDALWGESDKPTLSGYIKKEFNCAEILAGKVKDTKPSGLNPFKRKVVDDTPRGARTFPHDDSIKAMTIFAKQITEDFL
tara:strand:- start:885 stop:1766 length:882 start_codon:yes stop_codon:yes gene_type:complete